MSFKVLVRNPGSKLAALLEREFEDLPYALLCPGVEDFAWSNRNSLHSFFADQSPNVVVNFLPDQIPQGQMDFEISASMALASACLHYRVPLIQLSSYRCFGSDYREEGIDDDISPSPEEGDVQAKFFVNIEHAAAHIEQHLILRLPWQMDFGGDSLLSKIAQKLLLGEPIKVSSYYLGGVVTQSFVNQVITACIKQILCGAENWGIFNLHSADVCSEAEFSDALTRLLRAEGYADFPEAEIIAEKEGPRITYGCANLQGNKLTNNFGIQFPSWRLGFKGTTKNWLKDNGYKPE